MNISGTVNQFAFNNLSDLSDISLLSAMLKSNQDNWDFSCSYVEVTKEAKVGDQVASFTLKLDSWDALVTFDFLGMVYDEDIVSFSVGVDTYIKLMSDIPVSYINFIFNEHGNLDSVVGGLNELANRYFATSTFDRAAKFIFGGLPLIGVFPNPLYGILDSEIAMTITLQADIETVNKINAIATSANNLDDSAVLKNWLRLCLDNSISLVHVCTLDEYPIDDGTLIELGIPTFVKNMPLMDALVTDKEASSKGYSKLNTYNRLLKGILVDGLERIKGT